MRMQFLIVGIHPQPKLMRTAAIRQTPGEARRDAQGRALFDQNLRWM
jgi:hypothetical protein